MGWDRMAFYDAARDKSLSDAAARLALHLAGYADRNGRCFPSQARVADDLGWSLSKAKRAMGELAKRGMVTYRKRAMHRGETSLIQLGTGVTTDTGVTDDTSQNVELTGVTDATGVTSDLEPVSPVTLGTHPVNSVPTGEDKPPFTTRLADELQADHGWERPTSGGTYAAFQQLLTAALDRLPPERHQGVTMGVIADFVKYAQGFGLTSEARSHTARMVRLHAADDVLRGYGEALKWGAGIDAKYAQDPLSLSKYVASTLPGSKRGAA